MKNKAAIVIIPNGLIISHEEFFKVKKDIHPEYYDTKVKCMCGNVIETRTNKPEMSIEICSACHPFYTGQQKLIDTEGRVERFNRKYGTAAKE